MELVHLPVWTEYVKVLGTPIVALIAACIAGGIAYRQWKTARNKLKLDLFEKRFRVYEDAALLITETASLEPMEWSRVVELSSSFPAARWILSVEIAKYLEGLVELGIGTVVKPTVDLANMNEAQKIEWIVKLGSEILRARSTEIAKLDALFAGYLAVEH